MTSELERLDAGKPAATHRYDDLQEWARSLPRKSEAVLVADQMLAANPRTAIREYAKWLKAASCAPVMNYGQRQGIARTIVGLVKLNPVGRPSGMSASTKSNTQPPPPEINNVAQLCHMCTFWISDSDISDNVGDCRFNPPTAMLCEGKPTAAWPTTSRDAWCGKWVYIHDPSI